MGKRSAQQQKQQLTVRLMVEKAEEKTGVALSRVRALQSRLLHRCLRSWRLRLLLPQQHGL
jgi:hypothetical protein